jgi:hypothetical protein
MCPDRTVTIVTGANDFFTRLDSAEALRPLWLALNATNSDTLLASRRVYGGGMHKMESGELANVPAATLARLAALSTKARAD